MNISKINLKIFLTVCTGLLIFASCQQEFENPAGISGILTDAPDSLIRNPLFIPEVLSPTGINLTATPGTTDLGDGQPVASWEYNGNIPGPTLKANSGTSASILFSNNLPEISIIHWHGMVVNTPNDGHPKDVISTGQTYSYNFPIIQRAALNWYHPHPDMLTGKQVFLGLAGAFIINDAEEAALNLPSGNFEVPLIIRDVTLDNSNNIKYQPTAGGMFGKFPLVNGTKDPYLKVQRAVYRFRILNGANSRVMNLSLDNNVPMILIGNDGGLLPNSYNLSNIVVSNGERLDVLVDFRRLKSGRKIMLRDLDSEWDLLQFWVAGDNIVPYGGPLQTSSSIEQLSNPVVTRTFSFDGMSKINGLRYDIDRIDWTVPMHQTELWKFVAGGSGPHPVHVHATPFQVVSRTGGRGQLFPWESGWKDTVLLDDGETVSILIRFDEYAGLYLMHCHKLEHEDMGMMANFVVQ